MSQGIDDSGKVYVMRPDGDDWQEVGTTDGGVVWDGKVRKYGAQVLRNQEWVDDQPLAVGVRIRQLLAHHTILEQRRPKDSWRLWGFVPSAFTDMRPRQWCTGLTWAHTAIFALKPSDRQLNSILDRQVADSYRRILNQFASDRVTQYQRDWEQGVGKLTSEMVQQAMDRMYRNSTPAALVQQDQAMRAYWDERMAWARAKYGPAWSATLKLEDEPE
jgi:hypothetical protein